MGKGLKITLIIVFVSAIIVGSGVYLNQNYQVLFDGTLVEHIRPNDGTYKEYYEDGALKAEENYASGKRTGVWKSYHRNGALKTTLLYQEDDLHGVTSHFDSLEQLIFNEYFEYGKVVKREIVNDSLYKFQIVVLPHGRITFEERCSECHESKQDSLLSMIQVEKDTSLVNDLACIAMDSIHRVLFDSLFVENDSLFYEDKDLEPLNDYDIYALKRFLEQLSVKQNKLPKNPRKHRIKGKTS